jgi:tRNA (guanine-N7-)-methyltransferase
VCADAIEYELGVPIPGRILPADQWARTALKRLPPAGPVDWPAVFGRRAPLVLDLGCGNGRFTLGSALARPEMNHLGVDILPVVIRYATRRGNQRGLDNVRFAVTGGYELLENYVAAHSVAEVHLYHPQPYRDPEKSARRLITPAFLALVHRALVPDGLFVFQTDSAAYWRYLGTVVPQFFEFHEQVGPWPDAPAGRTRREIMARKKGLPVFRAWCRPHPGLDDAGLQTLAAALPLPEFDAGDTHPDPRSIRRRRRPPRRRR